MKSLPLVLLLADRALCSRLDLISLGRGVLLLLLLMSLATDTHGSHLLKRSLIEGLTIEGTAAAQQVR